MVGGASGGSAVTSSNRDTIVAALCASVRFVTTAGLGSVRGRCNAAAALCTTQRLPPIPRRMHKSVPFDARTRSCSRRSGSRALVAATYLLLAVGAGFATAPAAAAQGTDAVIRGDVRDAAGAALDGAIVRVPRTDRHQPLHRARPSSIANRDRPPAYLERIVGPSAVSRFAQLVARDRYSWHWDSQLALTSVSSGSTLTRYPTCHLR